MRYEVADISDDMPISKVMMERHIKQDIEDTDYFELLQKAIIKYITTETNMDILLTSYYAFFNCLSSGYTLKKNPITSLDKFEYLVDDSFVEIEDSFYLNRNNIYADVLINDDITLPSDIDDKKDNVRISFTSGYAEDEVPEDIQFAIMNIYASLNAYAGDCIDSKSVSPFDIRSNIPPMAQVILSGYTIDDFSIGGDYSGM